MCFLPENDLQVHAMYQHLHQVIGQQGFSNPDSWMLSVIGRLQVPRVYDQKWRVFGAH
jgi:hypothetical protein